MLKSIVGHLRSWRLAAISAGLGFALWGGIANPAHAQALVIGGEEIADAKLFAAAKAEREVLLYGTYPPEPFKPILDAFRADTGLKVDYVRLPTRNMFDRAVSEFTAGRLAADYLDLTDLPLIAEYIKKGMLQPYRVPNFVRISADIKDTEGRWYALIRDIQVIGVNTAIVKKEEYPKSWKNLLDPKWKGKLGAPSIDAGGSAFTAHTFLRQNFGEDFWKKFAAQNPRIYPAAAPTVTDLVRGETSVVMVGISLMLGQMQRGAPIQVIFPVEGISSFPIAGGVATTAKRPNAARLYLNWMTSRRGGAVIVASGAYAAHPEAGAPKPQGVQFPPADKVWNIKFDLWDKVRESYIKEWHQIFATRK